MPRLPKAVLDRLNLNPHIKSGIFDLVFVDWDELQEFQDNPFNWKRHPIRQRKALSASIKANSWGRTLVFNVTTGRFIDGHGRKDVAIEERLKNIPVALGRFTEEQELHLLQTADPLGAMYEIDQEALASLNSLMERNKRKLVHLEEESRKSLAKLHQDMVELHDRVSSGQAPRTLLPSSQKRKLKYLISGEENEEQQVLPEEESSAEGPQETSSGITEVLIDDDAIFESDLIFGLPPLLDIFASRDDVPEDVWTTRTVDMKEKVYYYSYSLIGSIPFPEERKGGVLGFFIADYRFDVAFAEADEFLRKLLALDLNAVVEPDYSTYLSWPLAVRVWNLYRARWCARFWQEASVSVIPIIRNIRHNKDLESPKVDEALFESELDIFIRSLPSKVPVVMCSMSRPKYEWEWKVQGRILEAAYEYLSFDCCIMYCYKDLRKYLEGFLPQGPEFVWLGHYQEKRNQEMREIRRRWKERQARQVGYGETEA